MESDAGFPVRRRPANPPAGGRPILGGPVADGGKANADSETAEAALDAYRDARIAGLRSALAILALLAIVALLFAQCIPTRQPGPT